MIIVTHVALVARFLSACKLLGPANPLHARRQFEATFGAGKDLLPSLVDSNTVTISKLMAIAPPGTLDPTPLLYADTMYGCAGLLAVGALANFAMRPVDPSHHMKP